MNFILLKFLQISFDIILFLPSFVINIFYHPLAKKSSWKQLPEVAEKLGLSYSQSKYIGNFGSLDGRVDGKRVAVFPDEEGEVTVSLSLNQDIMLWTKKYRKKASKKMPEFKTDNWKFNFIFKTCRATPAFSRRFKSSPELLGLIVSFYSRWMWRLMVIQIDERRICCKFNYGFPFFHHIPASALDKIVFDMVNLAQKMDAVFNDADGDSGFY